MNGAFEVGAVSLRSQQRALEAMANNIANVNTPTFKRADIAFAEIVANSAPVISQTEAMASTPIEGGVRFARRDTVAEQGQLRQTGQALDIAIDGAGFIELAGPQGQSLLWRGGRMMINRAGYLSTGDGIALKAMILLPDDAGDLVVGRDGVVSVSTGEKEQVEIGQLSIVRADGTAAFERLDNGLYRLSEDARVIEALPGEDGSGSIEQGMVEESNVDFSSAMIELLMIQRAYAASAQIVQAADQIAAISNNLKR